LRPHCKTHKLPQVTKLELARGIRKHKCATLAEAEMLAGAGVEDSFLAYNIVGANIARCVAFLQKFPRSGLKVQADHPRPVSQLGEAMSSAGLMIEVLVDLDVGQHRTGVEPGTQAIELYRQIAKTAGLKPGGLHVYDGHNNHADLEERRTAVLHGWGRVAELRDQLKKEALPVPRIVCGGTGSFPIYAALPDKEIELSPGTCVFNDAGYSDRYRDLCFPPATALLTRVISRPAADRMTLDLGYKAVASDPPAGKRLVFPDLPDAEQVLQNEEHLVLQTARACEFQPGDELYAFPWHICPSTALHRQVFVIENGQLVDRWDVTARDRWITV
jgi:D-threonine aldolase